MDTWYDKYFNNKIYEINEYDDFLKHFKIKIKNEFNILDKLKTDEDNYINKINYLKNIITIKNIKNEINNLTKLEILQKELNIIKILSKYTLQNNYLEFDFFIKCLEIIYHLSNNLRIHLKQPNLNHENLNKNILSRCSYKFCKFKDSCTYNYNKNNQICYQDHYVHNLVCADINVLINYIKKNYKNTDKINHNKEIIKSINTLCYVIGHMENELKNKCFYQEKKNWNNFHVSKKIINKIIKKKL